MSEGHGSSQRPTILIIEDDDWTATDLQSGLVGAGYAVRRAGSAGEALATLKSMQSDLILLSDMLPDADGLILCSTLRAHVPAPVIVMSTHSSEVDRALALASGAIECLAKPVDWDELLAQVKAAVHCQHHRSSARPPYQR
jgi:DNA-binding response OmpR family regulator